MQELSVYAVQHVPVCPAHSSYSYPASHSSLLQLPSSGQLKAHMHPKFLGPSLFSVVSGNHCPL